MLIPVLVLPLFSFELGILLPEQVRFPINASFCLLFSVAHRTRCAASSPAPSLIFLRPLLCDFSRAALPGEFLLLGFLVFSAAAPESLQGLILFSLFLFCSLHKLPVLWGYCRLSISFFRLLVDCCRRFPV
jgi:hypothetical protein